MFATILIHVPAILLGWLPLPAPPAGCQLPASTPFAVEEDALARFHAAVGQYVTLHRRLERWLPPERLFDDAEEMFAARDALRSAILDARPNARQGDIFTPDVAQLLIDRLDLVIKEQGYDPADILADINEERPPGIPGPEVNRPYPWAIASSMWPALLRALPILPPELEYRFSNRDLVLIDVHANLVLDILEGALPAGDDEIFSSLHLLLAE
jgi:hypothetical protein